MKQFVLLLPKNKVSDFVTYSYTNEIRIVTSVQKEPGFFDLGSETKVECHCVAADDKIPVIQASEWAAFIQK